MKRRGPIFYVSLPNRTKCGIITVIIVKILVINIHEKDIINNVFRSKKLVIGKPYVEGGSIYCFLENNINIILQCLPTTNERKWIDRLFK